MSKAFWTTTDERPEIDYKNFSNNVYKANQGWVGGAIDPQAFSLSTNGLKPDRDSAICFYKLYIAIKCNFIDFCSCYEIEV